MNDESPNDGMDRRTFVRMAGLGAAASLAGTRRLFADDYDSPLFHSLVPADKGLSAAWLNSLSARGEPEIYRGGELKYVGMPVGGLCAGLVYLGGDGKPWLWDIFNRNTTGKQVTYGGRTFGNRDGATYVEPLIPRSPLAHGVAIKFKTREKSETRTLDQDGGWPEITFQGNYPLATVTYRDPAAPVEVKLQAFSPFIPLNFDDSSLPATVLRYTVTNTGNQSADFELDAWLENVVLAMSSPTESVTRQNQAFKDANGMGMLLTGKIIEAKPAVPPDNASSQKGHAPVPPDKRHDAGTMAIYLMGTGPGISSTPQLPEDAVLKSHENRPIAGVRKTFTLAPDESATVTVILSWHFPNVDPVINGPDTIHSYAVRFPDAGAVARYVASNYQRLSGDTMAWIATWNDSTLPHWFLFRAFSNTCNLATTTSYRFANGQFWAWEGIYSCEGTCTHVWGYTQAMGRIFPELERALREKTDYAFAQNPNDGTINFRGTHSGFAADGQACIILRTYRDHLMSADDAFLKALWPRVRLAMDRLIRQVNDKGLLDGPQHNTLDTAWYGEVAWISGLYLAALRASEEMAKVCADGDYAGKCRQLFDKGSASLVPELFNGEYFYNKVDPKHLDAINSGTGCEIDQVMGQSWAWQVGLGRIFPKAETVAALKALWRYNFAPDAGRYHQTMKVGRWYAMPGEAGLLICTFPKPDWDFTKASGKGPAWAALYFNECQSGYEHEVASNMIAEGLVTEGLGVFRAIHDRYSAAKRNPYNEIECGDHYSRAMASYGNFISICGFKYDGPAQSIGFAPRLTAEDFKAAFTSARGWGSFAQKIEGGGMSASLDLKWGKLRVRTLSLEPPAGVAANAVAVTVSGRAVKAALARQGTQILIALAETAEITAGEKLEIALL
jgi:uncharacterized protein (DUF608 family)